MHKIGIFFSFIWLLDSSFAVVENANEPYIHGGKDANIKDYPWSVYIRMADHDCTGSIIGDQWVLTAGHCIQKQPPRQVRLYVGDSVRKRGNMFEAEKIYTRLPVNSEFDPSNDIGIIKTKKKFKYNSNIFPISLWPHKSLNVLWTLETAGFGMVHDEIVGERLQEVKKLKILPYDKCIKMLSKYSEAAKKFAGPDSILCTFNKRKAILHGDSGAGIVLAVGNKKYLVAVISCSGELVEHAKLIPAVSTKVYKHLDWIRSISKIVL